MFAAVNLKALRPEAEVTVLEGGSRLLAKVAVTGGGRCNLTNTFSGVRSLAEVYPRGARLMGRLFHDFSPRDTWDWFTAHGVPLAVRRDFDPSCSESERECVFPASQDAMTVVNCLVHEARKRGVRLLASQPVSAIGLLPSEGDSSAPSAPRFRVTVPDGELSFHRLVVAPGGLTPHIQSLLPSVIQIVPPVPSLFTLNLPDSPLRELMGTVVDPVTVGLAGTKLRASGALLVTHWGVSGPAVLRLSSYGARLLADCNWQATLSVNWLHDLTSEEAAARLSRQATLTPQRQLSSQPCFSLPRRLWEYLLVTAGIPSERRWAEAGTKQLHRLSSVLTSDTHAVRGQSRFKEEFVTCGGIDLSSLTPRLECRSLPGLYFAGEILDVDGITGGYNLQAAWTTAMTVARSIAQS